MSFFQRLRNLLGKGAACARFCEQVFPAGPDRARCVREGAEHTADSLCDACENDASRACKGPSGRVVCCQPMQVCDQYRGECV